MFWLPSCDPVVDPGAVRGVGVQHLQEQVIQWDNVLHLHVGQVLYPFVAVGGIAGKGVSAQVQVRGSHHTRE